MFMFLFLKMATLGCGKSSFWGEKKAYYSLDTVEERIREPEEERREDVVQRGGEGRGL